MTLGRFGKKDAGTGAGSFVRVDSLQMAYNGNQLTRVTDKGVTVAIAESEDFKDYANGSGQYTYNKNGALIKDTHKGILGISYNSLNLPRELAVKNSSVSGKNYYTYSASGVKLKTVHMGSTNLNYVPVFGSSSGDSNFNEVTTTEYIGNKVYENNVLKKILVEGGYYDVEKGKYFFYVQDHLGNNRLVADENGTVTQATHYYPFGQGFANSEGQSEQPYKYNGKEQDRRHGLNMYDYSARQMEPAIGRFTTVDPLAEKYYSISPYAYVANNPLRFIDPTGMWYGEFELIDGQWKKISNIGDDIGVDFYHTGLKKDGKEMTIIQDKIGNSSLMLGGRELLKGGEIRSNDVDWETITSEYLSGTGPDNSIFEGDHPSNLSIQKQLKYSVAKTNFKESGKGSQFTPIDWTPLDVALTPDMHAQMMGSYGASFYKLGDKTLSFIVDEKSKSSLFYHSSVKNTPREHKQVYNSWAGTWTQNGNMLNTTQQIYIFWAK